LFTAGHHDSKIFPPLLRHCIGLPASIGPTDIENHLLPYNLTLFAVPLFTVLNGVVLCAKRLINDGLGLTIVCRIGSVGLELG